MKALLCLLGSAVVLAASASSCDARAVGGIAEVTIVDRERGVTLTPYYYRGEYWVAGTPGARYAIEIHNRSGARVLAVTSVDGVNVLSGDSAAFNQAGYVFDPGESYEISGWRKSDTTVAAFTFTAATNSYAALTGRPQNVGVIGVALFRERAPPLAYEAQEAAPPPPAEAPSAGVPMNSPVPRALADAAAARGSSAGSAVAGSAAAAAKLGTGHGAREYSYVSHTEFARAQTEPNEIIRIRYDSLENLIAMGIVRRPRPGPPPPANPFPDAPLQQYVPDPPG